MEAWPEMLKVSELQKFLGIGYTYLTQMRQREDFPKPVRPTGKRPMFITEEVREWVRNLK